MGNHHTAKYYKKQIKNGYFRFNSRIFSLLRITEKLSCIIFRLARSTLIRKVTLELSTPFNVYIDFISTFFLKFPRTILETKAEKDR